MALAFMHGSDIFGIDMDVASLPDDPRTLKALLIEREMHLRERDELLALREQRITQMQREREEKIAAIEKQHAARVAQLELEKLRIQHRLDLLLKRYYGPRADTVEVNQLLLEFAVALEERPVDPADLPPDASAEQADPQQGRRVRRSRGRRKIAAFDKLPVRQQVHDLPVHEKACPCCGEQRHQIGRESTWQIELIPAEFLRIEHIQIKYACGHCEQNGHNPRIELAARPLQPIEKGMAGPGLLAYVATSKFADHLPLYRLQTIFQRHGFEIDRSTQCLWMRDVAEIVKPIYKRMIERVLQGHVIHTDDTVLPMLQPEKTKQARMWTYVGDQNHPYNVFHFSVRGEAVLEMREGLSQPDGRIRLQTNPNCGGKEPSWETSGAKGVAGPRQVWAGKTNASEPLRKCRENVSDVKTRELKWPWEQRRRCLSAADVTSGIEAASVRFGLRHGTSEPVASMRRKKSKRRPRKGESTDARHRDGTTRSSDEGRVMRLERRGRVILSSTNRSTAPAGGAHG
jgi:transposase